MNKLLFLFLLVIISNVLYGQTVAGMKLGLNVSNVSTSNQNDFDALVSYNAGVFFRFTLTNHLLLNTEALLSDKGFSNLLLPGGTTANHLSYLSFPVLVHYSPASKFYMQLGPELNLLVSAGVKNNSVHESAAEQYHKFDFSLAGGLGYKLFGNFNLEARYSHGLSQIRKNDNVFGAYKNRTLQINLLYLLRNKR